MSMAPRGQLRDASSVGVPCDSQCPRRLAHAIRHLAPGAYQEAELAFLDIHASVTPQSRFVEMSSEVLRGSKQIARLSRSVSPWR